MPYIKPVPQAPKSPGGGLFITYYSRPPSGGLGVSLLRQLHFYDSKRKQP